MTFHPGEQGKSGLTPARATHVLVQQFQYAAQCAHAAMLHMINCSVPQPRESHWHRILCGSAQQYHATQATIKFNTKLVHSLICLAFTCSMLIRLDWTLSLCINITLYLNMLKNIVSHHISWYCML